MSQPREVVPRAIEGETCHQWQGFDLVVGLSSSGTVLTLEVSQVRSTGPTVEHLDSALGARLKAAAEIFLEGDASAARSVRRGDSVTLRVPTPRPRPSPRIARFADIPDHRPGIEQLLAPLLFDSPARMTLRPFQREGVTWLIDHNRAILADDMGLGKTAQALVALDTLVSDGVVRSALIACPKSLATNWERECQMWAPTLTVVRSVPERSARDTVWSSLLRRSHAIVTTYEQLRPLPRPLREQPLELLIADEAHRLRRSDAQIVRAMRGLRTDRFWALTGTPIERHASDLATLLSLLEPQRFSSQTSTSDAEIRSLARPFVLRRLKSDELDDLPEVIESKELIELTPRQRTRYDAEVKRPPTEASGGVLERLSILRSICDVDLESDSSSKLDRIVDIIGAIHRNGEKAVVFSHLLRPLELLEARLARQRPALRSITLEGSLGADERARVVAEFKSNEGIVALLCSAKVGGEGLTLTEANHVIFINEWWNPSANAQARDRVVRLGQERRVHVHRFRCSDTVEELLDDILDRKEETFSSIVDALASHGLEGSGIDDSLAATLEQLDEASAADD